MKKLISMLAALMLLLTTTPALAEELMSLAEPLVVCQQIVFRLMVAEPVNVNGSSMRDTVLDGEIMLVTKYDYLFGDPERFDVVVCHYPERGNLQFIKRVVGIPGDTVEITGGMLYVNGEPMEEAYLGSRPNYTMKPCTLTDGQYFVLGDNRANSNDSHLIGPIDRKMIIGHARAVIWPPEVMRPIQ